MLAAMFIPKVCDALTLTDVMQNAADLGMVICVPTNFSPEREFAATFFPPDRIPNGWRQLIVRIKSPTTAVLEAPCVA